jgi:hypothetical protein
VITADSERGVQRRSIELARDETSITWGLDTGHLDCEYEVTVTRRPRVMFDFALRDDSADTWLELIEVSTASGTTVGFNIIEEARAGSGGVGVQLDDDLGTLYSPATTHAGSDYGLIFRPRPPAAASELRISVVQGERVLARWVADLTRPQPARSYQEARS